MFSVYFPFHSLHFVKPIEQVIIMVVIFSFKLFDCCDHCSLIIGQDGLRDPAAHAFKEKGKYPLKVLSCLGCHRAHSKKSNPGILVLPHKEANPNMFNLTLFSLQQFVSDIKTQQIGVVLIIFLHCMAAQEQYSILRVSPEDDIPLRKFLQQVVLILKFPEQFRSDIFCLLI